jgi:hypothetical protein
LKYSISLFSHHQARAKHDSSERHKNCIQLYHKKKREKNLHGASSELDLQNTLAAIEKAAYAALAQDKLGAPTASQGQVRNISNYILFPDF